MTSQWDNRAGALSRVLMRPILFNDLLVTFIEIIGARHGADWVSASHCHPWYEFNHVSHGAMYTKMEDTEFLAGAGGFFLIPPGVRHSHRHCGHSGDDGFCVRWTLEKAGLPRSMRAPGIAGPFIAALSACRPQRIAYASESLFELKDAPAALQQAGLIRWLMNIGQAMNPGCSWDSDSPDEHERNQVVQQALLYLDAHSSAQVDVNTLAESVGYSYRHLARLFKEQTGSTIVEKLNGIRIAKAIYLLENTDMSIDAVCAEAGFNTKTYFSTVFSAYTHMPPSVFRIKHRKF